MGANRLGMAGTNANGALGMILSFPDGRVIP
jgi:hypothetical protein